MKVFSATNEFSYSWPEVSTANWRKFGPWNEKSTHVAAVDTLSRRVEPESGILRTERLITCKQTAPSWLRPFIGNQLGAYVYYYEVSFVDPARQTLTMCSTNMTWSDLLTFQETVVYRPSPTSPSSKTEFRQRAEVTALCGGWQKIKNMVEDASVERFKENAERGKEGFEMVLAMSRRAFAQERERLARAEGAKL